MTAKDEEALVDDEELVEEVLIAEVLFPEAVDDARVEAFVNVPEDSDAPPIAEPPVPPLDTRALLEDVSWVPCELDPEFVTVPDGPPISEEPAADDD